MDNNAPFARAIRRTFSAAPSKGYGTKPEPPKGSGLVYGVKMSRLGPRLQSVSAAALAVLSACSGGITTAVPFQATSGWGRTASGSESPSSVRSFLRLPLADTGPSRMAPGAVAQDLLYVANSTTVTVYSYPSGKLLGTLKHFYAPQGECVDTIGDVFVTNFGTGQIFEYKHGGTKRIETLKSPTAGPIGCSVDSTTGNLAVSAFGGIVAIYKHARGKPTRYTDPRIAKFYWCAYDSVGDLFVDGQDSSSGFRFAELPKGSRAFTDITLNQPIGWPAGVQWQGDRVLVGDQNTPVIYEFKISGKSGSKVGRTPLGSRAEFFKQFWVEKQTLILPNEYVTGKASKLETHFETLYFKYPAGGKAAKAIRGAMRFPAAAVVSAATR